MNWHVYIRLLDAHLGPLMQEIVGENGDLRFQQDMSKVHTARVNMAWLGENWINL